jgi:hypothetical protein
MPMMAMERATSMRENPPSPRLWRAEAGFGKAASGADGAAAWKAALQPEAETEPSPDLSLGKGEEVRG